MSKRSGLLERRRAGLVARWRTSGETRAAFARRHGVHPRTFWGWCQAGEPASTVSEPAGAFLPVRVVDAVPMASTGEVEIVLASGDRIVVRGVSIATVLAQAVPVLRRAC